MSRYGLLDLPGIVFGWINAPLAAVSPEPIALAFWALVSSWATMWVYRHFSNQDEMAEIKPQIKAVQKKLSSYDGEFAGLKPLIVENFRLSGKHVLLALGPALLAGIPVLFVLVWVSNAFGLKMPEPGAEIRVEAWAAPDAEPARWSWRGTAANRVGNDAGTANESDAPAGAWQIAWPSKESPAVLRSGTGESIVELPPPRPTPVLHHRQWWNALIANPAGYLDADSPAEAVHLDLPKKQMLPFGPGWMRGWEFLYFTLLVIGSVALKFIWKIH